MTATVMTLTMCLNVNLMEGIVVVLKLIHNIAKFANALVAMNTGGLGMESAMMEITRNGAIGTEEIVACQFISMTDALSVSVWNQSVPNPIGLEMGFAMMPTTIIVVTGMVEIVVMDYALEVIFGGVPIVDAKLQIRDRGDMAHGRLDGGCKSPLFLTQQ